MNQPHLRFAARFLIGLGVLLALGEWGPAVSHVREPLCRALASATAQVYTWFGVSVLLDGNMMRAGAGALRVTPQCDGLVLFWLFLAGVSAEPLRRGLHAWRGVLFGLAVLAGLNWLRVVALAFAFFFYPSSAHVLHNYILQAILILSTLVLYLRWLDRTERVAVESPGRSL